MRDDTKSQRQTQIEAAAYALLEEKGYAGTSMQGIARRAKASNETLYNWYGDKQGLFKALVTRNAAEVKALLTAELASGSDAAATLDLLGPKLLELLLGNRAIALNRAAAADPTGELGTAIAEAGRDSVLPLLVDVLVQAQSHGYLGEANAAEAAALYLDLLVGDLQIRRVIGRLDAPTPQMCRDRARLAQTRLQRLLNP